MRILIVDNYDSYTWNLVHLVWKVAGVKPIVVRNDEFTTQELLDAGFTHIIISPGPGNPTSPEDFGVCSTILKETQVPCLGVCLGHQGLASSFGGNVIRAPEIFHGRLSTISHEESGVFAGLPQHFKAVRYHSLAVSEPLPSELNVTARSDTGLIMGIQHRSRPLHGVQFHPESIETEFGDRLIANFLEMRPAGFAAVGPMVNALGSTGTQRRTIPSLLQSIPVKTLVEPLMIDIDAPTLFEHAFARNDYSFWLDSSNNANGMGNFSFMGSSANVVRYFATDNTVQECTPVGTTTYSETIFEYLQRQLAVFQVEPTVEMPFAGGFVGYLGYGSKAVTGIGRGSRHAKPDAEYLRVDRFVAFDHVSNTILLVTVGLTPEESKRWCQDIRNLASGDTIERGASVHQTSLKHVIDYSTYKTHFESVQEWLRRGDSYEACYTHQIQINSDADPVAVYRRLRTMNPAPYSAFMRFGCRSVLCSSPERFVRIGADGWVETKPIKGTCARHDDPVKDREAKERLAVDVKTRSENLMIVDLMRNDLGKVCDAGTVDVPKLMAVESYATVHQLVTTVRGKLLEELTPVDCVKALFPGGSMTGAPKKRTVELLDNLEPDDRGIYSGSIGYFSFDGNADLNIVIRTIVWEGDGSLSIGVGGALTIMSDPEEEYQECRLKSRALLNALELSV